MKSIIYLRRDRVRFYSDYATWTQAEKASTDYLGRNILERTRHAMLKVTNGQAAYTRDAVPLISSSILSNACRVVARAIG